MNTTYEDGICKWGILMWVRNYFFDVPYIFCRGNSLSDSVAENSTFWEKNCYFLSYVLLFVMFIFFSIESTLSSLQNYKMKKTLVLEQIGDLTVSGHLWSILGMLGQNSWNKFNVPTMHYTEVLKVNWTQKY